jgi:hypothetical protein
MAVPDVVYCLEAVVVEVEVCVLGLTWVSGGMEVVVS